MEHFQNFRQDKNTLTFEVFNVELTILNALRRIMISEIPTLAFKTEFGKESDIKIIGNTSGLHNEFLAHRISLIPIHYSQDINEILKYNKDKYLYSIKIQNTTNKIINITTEHIQVEDTESGRTLSQSDKQKLFPPDEITKDYILLNKLKPNNTDNQKGELLDITMKADIGIGKEHARYSPTCVSIFTNKQDPKKVETELTKYIESKKLNKMKTSNTDLTQTEIENHITSFNVMEADRHFYTDDYGNPCVFDFKIETDGRIHPKKIFDYSFDIINDKLDFIIKNINNEEIITFTTSNGIMNSFDIIIKNEDYTLGNLLQYFINKIHKEEDNKVKYVACNKPHPLINELLLKICLDNTVVPIEEPDKIIEYLKSLLTNTLEQIKSIIKSYKKEVLSVKLT